MRSDRIAAKPGRRDYSFSAIPGNASREFGEQDRNRDLRVAATRDFSCRRFPEMIYRAIAYKKACSAAIARKSKGPAQTKGLRQKGKAEALSRVRGYSCEGQALNCCAGHYDTVFSFSRACPPFFSIVRTKPGDSSR